MNTQIALQDIAQRHHVPLEEVEDEYMECLSRADSIDEALWMLEVTISLQTQDVDLDEIPNTQYKSIIDSIINAANSIFGKFAMVV